MSCTSPWPKYTGSSGSGSMIPSPHGTPTSRSGLPPWARTSSGIPVMPSWAFSPSASCRPFAEHAQKPLALYAGLVSLSFLVYGAVFKFDILGSRYHVPFFVLLAPLVGVVLGSSRGWVQAILIACLAASAYRPLVQLEERPILNLPGRPSIFLQPREDLYLGDDKLAPIYRQYTSAIRAEGCNSLGLMLNGNTREYPIWVLMGAPRDTLTVDWIVSRGVVNRQVPPAGLRGLCRHLRVVSSFVDDPQWPASGSRYRRIPAVPSGGAFGVIRPQESRPNGEAWGECSGARARSKARMDVWATTGISIRVAEWPGQFIN